MLEQEQRSSSERNSEELDKIQLFDCPRQQQEEQSHHINVLKNKIKESNSWGNNSSENAKPYQVHDRFRDYSNTRLIEGKKLDLFSSQLKKSSSEIFMTSRNIQCGQDPNSGSIEPQTPSDLQNLDANNQIIEKQSNLDMLSQNETVQNVQYESNGAENYDIQKQPHPKAAGIKLSSRNSPQKNTLRNYQEEITDDDLGFSRNYQKQFKSSKKTQSNLDINRKILEFEKKKLQSQDGDENTNSEKHNIVKYGESEIKQIKLKQVPHTDLSDHNSFVRSSPEQLMRLWGQKKKSPFFRGAQTSEGAAGYFKRLQNGQKLFRNSLIPTEINAKNKRVIHQIDEQEAPSSPDSDEQMNIVNRKQRKNRRVRLVDKSIDCQEKNKRSNQMYDLPELRIDRKIQSSKKNKVILTMTYQEMRQHVKKASRLRDKTAFNELLQVAEPLSNNLVEYQGVRHISQIPEEDSPIRTSSSQSMTLQQVASTNQSSNNQPLFNHGPQVHVDANPQPVNELDQNYINSNFGIRDERDLMWEQLRKIGLEYVTMFFTWIACLCTEEPDCGIPMKTWVSYYLFFRLFRNGHNLIGILLILNETPVYYKATTKMIIFAVFEGFETCWMVYGINLFFLSSQNKCLSMNRPIPAHQRVPAYNVMTAAEMKARDDYLNENQKLFDLSHNFVYICMTTIIIYGILIVFNAIMVTLETFSTYGASQIEKIEEINFRVQIVRSVSKYKYRTCFFHAEMECIICWELFRDREYVTRLNCHQQHFFHTRCIKEWIKKGNNSCPLCRQTIYDENARIIGTGANIRQFLKLVANKVGQFIRNEQTSNTESASDTSLIRRQLASGPLRNVQGNSNSNAQNQMYRQ